MEPICFLILLCRWAHPTLQARIKPNLKKILQKNRRCHFDKRDALIWKLVSISFLIGVQGRSALYLSNGFTEKQSKYLIWTSYWDNQKVLLTTFYVCYWKSGEKAKKQVFLGPPKTQFFDLMGWFLKKVVYDQKLGH